MSDFLKGSEEKVLSIPNKLNTCVNLAQDISEWLKDELYCIPRIHDIMDVDDLVWHLERKILSLMGEN